jgi:hypothetical protein
MRIELACERKNCNMSVFSSGRNILLMKNTLFWRNGVTHVPFGTVKSVLWQGVLNIVSLWELRQLLKGILLPLKVFKWETYSLCSKYHYSSELKKNMYLLEENHLCYKHQCLAHCFPVRIVLECERNTCYLSVVSSRRIIHFMKNTLFWWNCETHVSFGRIQSLLEAVVSGTLFLYYNWINF